MLSTLSLPASDPSLAPAPDRAPLPLRARQAERLAEMLEAWQFPEPIFVTRPTLPSLADYTRQLEAIWESHKLTNNGPLHRRLEEALTRRLDVEHLSLTCNGTIALLIALQALRINGGEIIVTPFTYPPTVHVLYWLQVKPVFCDIDPLTWTIDPARIEALITPETRAIMGVHVYGRPCAVDEIQAIADRHGLHVIYDAAQAFGVEVDGRSVLRWGDMSTLSFHATKLYSTIEGGAIVTNTPERKQRVDFLKNFGIADEETVIGPGINGKLNEMQAAYGLLRLDDVDREIERRRELTAIYGTDPAPRSARRAPQLRLLARARRSRGVRPQPRPALRSAQGVQRPRAQVFSSALQQLSVLPRPAHGAARPPARRHAHRLARPLPALVWNACAGGSRPDLRHHPWTD